LISYRCVSNFEAPLILISYRCDRLQFRGASFWYLIDAPPILRSSFWYS
jgi:hypothetical protein